MRSAAHVCLVVLVVLTGLALARPATAQVNTVDLSGQVLDPQGLVIAHAKIVLTNKATGATRDTESLDDGSYKIVGLPPGRYEMTVEAKGMARLDVTEIILTIGQAAVFDARMTVTGGTQSVTVTGEPQIVETSRTAVASTVNLNQITNLPINGRNYIDFTLLTSETRRDDAPSIGAAPTSGLNFSGQRGRSNEVSVDGADAVDNSVNGIRSTVSQEAVQEFQIITSNYMPEYGRAMGGVVNIVTKSGGNQVHGNLFGYLRHKSIQARNPFSIEIDPVTGLSRGVKQDFTRVQAGATLGGPIQKDRTFYFLSYETTRRQETGFTDIGVNNFDLTPASNTLSCFGPTPFMVTPEQNTFYQSIFSNPANCGNPAFAGALKAAAISGAGSWEAIHGNLGPYATVLGYPGTNFFPLPVPCLPGPQCLAPLPASFIGLDSLIGNYPIKEGTSYWSGRLDHLWNSRNTSFVRATVSPSLVTGIQVNAQNQNFGQNAGSRTSLQQYRDLAVVGQHDTTFSANWFNEARFQFARRGLHYGFSQLPGGSNVAVNIPGFAFFGREPFSTVDRIERRFQWTDNVTWIHGNNTFKWGADANLIQIRSSKAQTFELNFGGLYNFGALPGSILPGGAGLPAFSAIQTYGLGLPQVFDQGIGHSMKPFDNKTLGVFIQDSWKIHPRLILNFGVRYDIEWTPMFKPGTPFNAAAEPALGIVEGIPVDANNVAPRFGLAWDPTGSGKTVVRASYGLFYDHPLLAIAFDSTTADGALSTQLTAAGGGPSALPVTPLTALSTITPPTLFQGILGGIPSAGGCGAGVPANFGYLCQQQRFDPLLANSVFTGQQFLTSGIPIPLLPFTLPVEKNFVYAYGQEANLAIEHEFAHDFKFSASATWEHGVHLNRPRSITATNPAMLNNNALAAIESGVSTPGSNPLTIQIPSSGAPLAGCPAGTLAANTAGGGSIIIAGAGLPFAPGIVGEGFTAPNCGGMPVGSVATPAVFNFFRPTGPNPSFSLLVNPANFTAGYDTLVTLAGANGYPVGRFNAAGPIPMPYSDVDAQESSGKSIYTGLTLSIEKRFSHHVQFLSSWTWSHAIDDSTDLQTLLNPQNNNAPGFERSSSTFDQRHRWVSSAVLDSPFKSSDDGWWRKVLANFTVAPIWELASGRPFTVLTGTDFNNDTGSNTDRPGVVRRGAILPPGVQTATSPFLPGVIFTTPFNCPSPASPLIPVPPNGCTGNESRNSFVRPGFVNVDLRVSRKFYFSETMNLEVISEVFNLFNHFNVADVDPLCNPLNGSTCTAGQPTAALDPRQFQFALKVNF